jgi:hypothetical protein
MADVRRALTDAWETAIGLALRRAYPRVPWLIEARVSPTGGLAIIKSPAISGHWGRTFHLPATIPEVELLAVRAAGEMLERFRIHRGAGPKVDADILRIPRNIRGEAIGAARGEL